MSSGTLGKVLQIEYVNAGEVDLFQACMRWARAECQRKGLAEEPINLRSVFEAHLTNIRFPAMTLEQYSDTVVPSGMLNDKEGFLLYQCFTCKNKPQTAPFPLDARENIFDKPYTLLSAGPFATDNGNYGNPITKTNVLKCSISKTIKLQSLILHAFIGTNPHFMSSNVSVNVLQQGESKFTAQTVVPTQTAITPITSADKPGVTHQCCEIAANSTLLAAGNFDVDITMQLSRSRGSMHLNLRQPHFASSLQYGSSNEATMMADKHLSFSIEKTDKLPLLGIRYMVA
jgi:hypothetical protein